MNIILSDFINYLGLFLKTLGEFDESNDVSQLSREFLNKFYCNLISIENHLNCKDSTSAALLQRYNHELFVDFFYIFGDLENKDSKIEKFFNYKKLSTKFENRSWCDELIGDKRKFIPPSVGDEQKLKETYKKLSDMAHSNIVSMGLNRKGNDYEYKIINLAIVLIIVDITNCLLFKPFRDWFSKIFDQRRFLEIKEFQNDSISLFKDKYYKE